MGVVTRAARHGAWRWTLPLSLIAALLASVPAARAADVTDQQAEQLEAQLRTWLAGLTGPHADLGDRPIEVSADNDHFELKIPFAEALPVAGARVSAAPMLAQLRPLDGGRWSMDFQLPSPMKVAAPTTDKHGDSVTTATIEEQQNHAVIDPSLAGASTFDGTLRGYAANTVGAGGEQRVRVDEIVSHATAQPAGNGRVNVLSDQTAHLLTMNILAPDVGPVAFSAEQGRAVVQVDDLAPDRLAPLVRVMFELGPQTMMAMREAAMAGPGDGARSKAAKPKLAAGTHAALRAAVLALRDLAGGIDEQITVEDVHVQAVGFSAHMARFATGMGVSASDGKLALRMRFAVDGLDSADIPPGPLRDMVPHHIVLAPRFAGLPGNAAMDLLLRALDSEGNDPKLEADAQALLNRGPITVGLDELAFDVGPAALTGRAELLVQGKTRYSGTAHLSATGLDALIRRANTTPQLKQAAPVLIFMKGIGQQNNDTTVWDLSWQDNKLLVNGTDMTQLMPGK